MPVMHEVRIFSPVEENGETTLVPQDIQINLEHVHFTHKPPMQPTRQIAMLLPGPLLTSTEIDESKLEEAGLVQFDSSDGTPCWLNPQLVQFYFTPELGVYVLVFPGGNRLGVKATGIEVAAAFGGSRIQI